MPAAAATDRALARTAVEVRAANPPRRASEARTDANERVREAMSASHNDVGGAQNLIAKKRSIAKVDFSAEFLENRFVTGK